MQAKATKATKPAKAAPKAKATKPAALPKPVILKPSKAGPVVVDPAEAKLREVTIAYVRGDQSCQASAAEVAGMVAARYKSRDGFEGAKEAYQQGFILPGLAEQHRKAFAVSIPDGRTEDGKAPKWKAARKARATVQKILSQYFSRIRERAFPAEDTAPATLDTWTADMLARIIKRHEKADDGKPGVIKACKKALAENSVIVDSEEGDE